ncbi:hypothetical protein Pan189_11700 [Stratiformator vulcanicus]|uniref:Uncharacterized protein n=1 Tax=Stratiformator vulcanicus TaxID=2527980 RepID=A0A517QYS5_9PLAN|nr:hypothetical protein Pan189_11700 [Stratiformator vulcanicus]
MGLDRVPKRRVGQHLVTVSTPDTLPTNNAFAFQIGDDPLHCPFRNSDLRGDETQDRLGIRVNHEQDVRMVRQERPAGKPVLAAFALLDGCR